LLPAVAQSEVLRSDFSDDKYACSNRLYSTNKLKAARQFDLRRMRKWANRGRRKCKIALKPPTVFRTWNAKNINYLVTAIRGCYKSRPSSFSPTFRSELVLSSN
jgi:hypothetical protein